MASNPDPSSERLWVEPALLSDALRLAGAFAFEMGEDGHLDFADRLGLTAWLGEETSETSKDAWQALLSQESAERREQAVASLTSPGARYQIEYSIGSGRKVRETAEAMACADGRATLIRGVILTLAANRGAFARQDILTGLPNRIVLDEFGSQLADIGERIGIPAHLLRIRLSNLDRLTKTYGEAVRNQMLKEAGERLQAALRTPDFVARLDGADFAAVTLNSDPDTLALRLRAAITAELYETLQGPLALELDTERVRLTSVEQALDETQYKMSGVAQAASVPDSDLPSVEDAISKTRLSLAFQPIVHARSHALHHFEVLLRLKGMDGQNGSAFPFIVDAEDRGEVHRIDQFVLDAVKPWLVGNPALELAINVSAGTIGHESHAEDYLEALRDLGDLASRLTLEMTETLAIDDPAMAERFSTDVRALGCRFAVDDFASGHTSFRTLLGVDADCIKIDGSLVRGVALDENKQAFIRMMVDLARTVSVETVAEMIEDKADADVLARLGVDYLQGYYFGKPGPEPVWSGLQQK